MPSKSRYGFKVSLQNFVKKKLVTFTFFCIFFIFRLVTFKAEGIPVVVCLLILISCATHLWYTVVLHSCATPFNTEQAAQDVLKIP